MVNSLKSLLFSGDFQSCRGGGRTAVMSKTQHQGLSSVLLLAQLRNYAIIQKRRPHGFSEMDRQGEQRRLERI